MDTFEWMELQTLTGEITTARSRLAVARSERDYNLVRILEDEIAAAEQRRAHFVSHLTTHLAANPEGGPPAEAVGGSASSPLQAAAEEPLLLDRVDAVNERPEPVHRIGAEGVSVALRAQQDRGAWDQLARCDLDRARSEIGRQRAEMRARHAQELRALDADQSELETLERAIAAFAQKFNLSSGSGAVVKLDEEREVRLQGRA
jgi:hypothetical protein